MHLVFLSNYFNHHQKSVCEEWDRLTNHDFAFIETEEFSDERKQMGWKQDRDLQFVSRIDGNEDEKILSEINDADYVIFGGAPLSLVKKRLTDKKLVFKYSERVFKHGYDYRKWLPRLYTYRKQYGRYKSLYLLASSAYTAADFSMHGVFRGKSYKWGYFPRTLRYDIGELLSKKNTHKILWCGRLLPWKHPEYAIEVARRLKNDGVDFDMDIIGVGEMTEVLSDSIIKSGLSECVHMLGSMSPDEVRRHMETAGIFLFTSDFGEGWGAVLNESMNSGCAVVASHAIGSVPFLLDHEKNGMIYLNCDVDDLYEKTRQLLADPSAQHRLGEQAYLTIIDKWNAQVAAERFLVLADHIKDHGYCNVFADGPCSRADSIKNNWFRK